MIFEINPKLDLVLERNMDVSVELVWKAWTEAEHLKKWFAPKPWDIPICEIDLRPGGCFKFVMKSPKGQEEQDAGCYLEIIKNQKLVWTSALLPGYRPAMKPTNSPQILFTAIVELEKQGDGTKMTIYVIHANEETKLIHEKMGFHEGWGICIDQMDDEIKHGRID